MALQHAEWVTEARCTPHHHPTTREGRALRPDDWFPDLVEDAEEPKRICRHCPVKAECYEMGKSYGDGIWGGIWIRQSHVERPVAPRERQIDPLGSVRRLRALAVLGWTPKDVAVDINRYTGVRIRPLLLTQIRAGEHPRIESAVAGHITRSFGHLKNLVNSGTSAAAAMNHADSLEWAGPYAWRGIDIDDPEAKPRVH